jgi:hypothetical protein
MFGGVCVMNSNEVIAKIEVFLDCHKYVIIKKLGQQTRLVLDQILFGLSLVDF